ncbi:MAG: uncharacterized protein QOF51_1654, partial [Chloroflexota bacterium]|nr:uncharacterized protein [Chloroflexota bacterium]
MTVIDSDCHVIESEHTWDFMDESEGRFRPTVLTSAAGKRFLSINGELRYDRSADGTNQGRDDAAELERAALSGRVQTTQASRIMQDIPGRLHDMDELGVDIQVLYPTMGLFQLATPRPDVESALSRSYNRWLAEIWQQAEGRLRWVALLPLLNMGEALQQLRWSVAHGACGVYMHGFEGDRLLCDPYFFPLYEEAQGLGVPICVHAGAGNRLYGTLVGSEAFSSAKLPVISSFHSILYHEIPDKFPTLRFGFIETAAGWVPHVMLDLERRLAREGRHLKEHPLRDNRMFVA